jgi:hypothetical protein
MIFFTSILRKDILSVAVFNIYSIVVAWFWNHGNHSFRETVGKCSLLPDFPEESV